MSAWLRLTWFLLLGAAAGLVAVGSGNTFYLASGSDSGVEIFTPSLVPKVIALVFVVAAFAFALYGTKQRALVRWAAGGLGLFILAIATHALVFNHKRGVIEEYWLLYKFDRAHYDVSEGVLSDWEVRTRPLGVELRRHRDGATVFLPTGFPPFNLDLAPVLAN